MFQSSPAPKSGCYSALENTKRKYKERFNPHPLQRAGATPPVPRRKRGEVVSILTRSKERVLPSPVAGVRAIKKVSILTRSKERVLRPGPGPDYNSVFVSILTRSKERVLRRIYLSLHLLIGFQSSPAPKSGCYNPFHPEITSTRRFQSSPAPKSGCYSGRKREPRSFFSFNPHPLQRAGATYCRKVCLFDQFFSFNPHPLQRAGATIGGRTSAGRYDSFNPHPLQRAGATAMVFIEKWIQKFQSSPAPKSGCYDSASAAGPEGQGFNPHPLQRAGATASLFAMAHILDVSILTRSKERVLLPASYVTGMPIYLFQSSPAPKSGCYDGELPLHLILLQFQSSPAPKSGCYTITLADVSTTKSFNPHPLQRAGATAAHCA